MMATISMFVQNFTSSVLEFYFFVSPTIHTSGGTIQTNSLYSNSASPGNPLSIAFLTTPIACAQEASNRGIGTPSGAGNVNQAIELSDGSKTANNATFMSASPLALSAPTNEPGVMPGAFRMIVTSSVIPPNSYNAGLAIQTSDGATVLASFVSELVAGQAIDITPPTKFYVQIGNFSAGTSIDFGSASQTAAVCYTDNGQTSFRVCFYRNGTWSVQ